MADRTVVTRLVLDLAGYTPQTVEASKSASALATAQKETATAARDAGIAQREAAAVAKDAAAQASAAAQAQAVAYKEAATAAKEASAAQVAAAEATGEADRADAEAAAQAAAARLDAAKEALAAATTQAEADAQTAAAAKAGAVEADRYAQKQRDVAAAAKESATAEATAAKESAAAAAERTKAYQDGGKAMNTAALVSGAAIGLMVKDAGDFQNATDHFVTDAGESQKNLGMIQAGILKTSVDVGASASSLNDAMYHVESAGYHGADALAELTTAAQGAKVGQADLGVVAKTLTGTMNSYNMQAGQSVSMMNQIIATTAAGDMRMNDLAGSLGNVTPKAAAAGLAFSQVGGAVATMTSQNMSADRATQDLASTIDALQKPNSVQIAQMQQLGLDANDVSQNLGSRGLTGTLQMLTTAVAEHTQNGQVFIDTLKNSQSAAEDANTMLAQLPPSIQDISKQLLDGNVNAVQYKKAIADLDAPSQHQAQQFEQLVKSSGAFNTLLASGKPEAETYNAALSNLLGGTTGLNTALMLTGGRMATFQANVASVQAAADKGGTSVDGWAQIQGTFNQKMDVAKAAVGALGIAIGTTLLPVTADVAKAVTSVITPIAEWVDKHQTLTAIVLGSVAALAAFVLAINGAIKIGQMVKTAVDGVRTAIDFFSKSADGAAVKADALAVADAAAAKEAEALGTASASAAVQTDALAASQTAAATEGAAAASAVGSAGLAGTIGRALPVIGGAVAGIGLLADAFTSTGGDAAKAAASVDQFTTAMVQSKTNTTDASMAFGHAADDLNVLSEALSGKLAVNTKFEGQDVVNLKRSFDFLAESSVASVEPMAQLGVELGKVNQVSGAASNSLKAYDGGLASLVQNGQIDRAKQLMAEISQVTDNHGKALINTARDFPQYFAALDKLQSDQILGISTTQSATAALNANAAATLAGADATATATDSTAAATTVVSGAAVQQQQAAAAADALAVAQAAAADKTLAGVDATQQAIEEHKLGTAWLQAVAGAENDAAGSASQLDTSVTNETAAMKDAQAKASNLSDALNALNGVHITASKAAVDEQQKLDDLNTALDKNGKTLDITTSAGRANVTAIDDLATAANAHAQAVAEESGSIDAGNKALDASRAEFDAVLKSAGYSTTQIDTFNKTLLNTPKLTQVTLSVTADTSAAAAALQQLETRYGGTGIAFGGGGSGGRHIVSGYYTGGLVTGAGTGTSDSNMVAVSNREYIVNAAAVARPGVLDALNALNFGSGTTSVVKPQIPLYPMPAQAASPGSGSGAALHVENYFENGSTPQQVAAELAWLAKSRGASW